MAGVTEKEHSEADEQLMDDASPRRTDELRDYAMRGEGIERTRMGASHKSVMRLEGKDLLLQGSSLMELVIQWEKSLSHAGRRALP